MKSLQVDAMKFYSKVAWHSTLEAGQLEAGGAD